MEIDVEKSSHPDGIRFIRDDSWFKNESSVVQERINGRLMPHYMEIDVEKIKLSVWCPACFLPFRLHFCRKCVTFAVRLKQNADVHAINNTYQ